MIESNDELVDYLVERQFIVSEEVEDAFRSVDRADYVDERFLDHAYSDRALPIDDKVTISAPHMVARITELLEIEESDKIIEIGSGSGYQLAILSELSDNKVIGVERIDELVKGSRNRLKDRENISIIHGSGFNSMDTLFDRILYSCAVPSFDEAKRYLRDDGLMVAPIGSDNVQILKKFENGEITDHGRVRFVKFVDE